MLLADEQVLFPAIPAARPVLVGPAEAEGEVDGRVVQVVQYRCLEQSVATEPIEIEAEPADAVSLCQLNLAALNFGVAQIVVAHVDWHPGLKVAVELGRCRAYVGPLGEPFSPPAVVFRDGVELGQIERDEPYGAVRRRFAPELRDE